MNDHASQSERPAAVAQSGRRPRRRLAIAAGIAAAAFLGGAFAGSPTGHRVLTQVPLMMPQLIPFLGPDLASAAPFEDGGPDAGWRSGLYDDIIGAVVETHADRVVRHVAIEIDATPEQVDKLRAIVHDAVKDLLPFREKIRAMRAAARDLLTQEKIDRAAIEKFRTDTLAIHDAASKRVFQAVADAAEVLTPDQRRKLADMAARRGPWGPPGFGHWGRPWGHGPWGHW